MTSYVPAALYVSHCSCSHSSLRSDFSDTERDFYQAVYTRSKTQIEGYVKEGSILNKYIQVLTLLLRLRQACDHPYLCIGRGRTEKEWEVDVTRFISRFAAKNLSGKGENGGMSVEYIAEVGETLKKMRKAQKKKAREPQQLVEQEEKKKAPDSTAEPSEETAGAVGAAPVFLAPPQDDEEEEEHWHECPICLSQPQEPVLTEWSAHLTTSALSHIRCCTLLTSRAHGYFFVVQWSRVLS